MFLLFIFGVVFSYVLVIPLTLDFLYKYGESIGAETLLTVNDFIAFTAAIHTGIWHCISASSPDVCFISKWSD